MLSLQCRQPIEVYTQRESKIYHHLYCLLLLFLQDILRKHSARTWSRVSRLRNFSREIDFNNVKFDIISVHPQAVIFKYSETCHKTFVVSKIRWRYIIKILNNPFKIRLVPEIVQLALVLVYFSSVTVHCMGHDLTSRLALLTGTWPHFQSDTVSWVMTSVLIGHC